MRRLFVTLGLLSAFVFIAAFRVGAAVTVNSVSSYKANATSFTWSHTVNSGTKKMLLVGVSVNNGSAAVITSVTFGGTPLSPQAQFNVGSQNTLGVFYLAEPAVATADIIVTLSTGAQATMGAVTYNYVDSIGASAQNSGVLNNPTIDITTSVPDSSVVNFYGSNGLASFAKDASVTQRYLEETASASRCFGGDLSAPAVQLYTITHTHGFNAAWTMYAMELIAAPENTPTVTQTVTQTITGTPPTATVTATVTATATPTSTCGTVYTVCSSGCDSTTIAGALALSSVDCDRIEIQENITEGVTLNKNIAEIYGSDPSITWSMNGNSANRNLGIDTGLTQELVVRDLRIIHTSGNAETVEFIGIAAGQRVVFENCEFSHPSAANINYTVAPFETGHLTLNRCLFSAGSSAITSPFVAAVGGIFNITNSVFTGMTNRVINIDANYTVSPVIYIYNNTFHNNNTAIFLDNRADVKNNIFTSNTDDILLSANAALGDFQYNAFGQADEALPVNNITTGIDSVEYISAFLSNFNLMPGSEAVNSGTDVFVYDDYEENIRPNGSGYDIGAYECVFPDTVLPVIVNDDEIGNGNNQYQFNPCWEYADAEAAAYNNDNHWSSITDAFYEVDFYGVGILVYCALNPNHGIVAISIDGGPETMVDLYSGVRVDDTAVYSSGLLSAAQHTLKVRVTGTKNALSTGYYGAADRVIVFEDTDNPTPEPTALPTVVNDNTTGTGNDQFDFTGSWGFDNATVPFTFLADNHYSNTTGDYFTVRFIGNRAFIYGSKTNDLGIAGISIDGGAETMVDLYSPNRCDQMEIFDTGELVYGAHYVTVRVTGNQNPSSAGVYLTADRIDIYSWQPPTETITKTITPTVTQTITETPVVSADLLIDDFSDAAQYSSLLNDLGGWTGSGGAGIVSSAPGGILSLTWTTSDSWFGSLPDPGGSCFDATAYNYLQFDIRSTTSNVDFEIMAEYYDAACSVESKPIVMLSDYIVPDATWRTVKVPFWDFAGFVSSRMRAVTFYNFLPAAGSIEVDNLKLVYINATPTTTMTVSQSVTPTITQTITGTFTQTITPSSTPSSTSTITETNTQTQTSSVTQTLTETNTQTITRTITPSVTNTSTPSVTSTNTQTTTQTMTPTVTQSVTGTITPSVTASITVSVTQTNTSVATNTTTQTVTETMTQTITGTYTQTVTSSVTETNTQTTTPTVSQSVTPSITGTVTPSVTASITVSVTQTNTSVATNTTTQTVTETMTQTITGTYTQTVTSSVTETNTQTTTPTVSQSVTPSITGTVTPSVTASITVSVTQTNTSVATNTTTQTVTETMTQTITGTYTQTVTSTVTETNTRTITQTMTPTVTQSVTGTITPSVTASITMSVTQTNTSVATNTTTQTVTETMTQTITGTYTQTVTSSVTETNTQTTTPTVSQSVTPSITGTVTPSVTASITMSVTQTNTSVATNTTTQTETGTMTQTITVTVTASSTSSTTPTITKTTTKTITSTATQSMTGTVTPSVTQTLTMSVTQTITLIATEAVTETFTQSVTATLTGSGTQTVTQTTSPSSTATVTETITSSVTQSVTNTVTATMTPTNTIDISATDTQTATQTITSSVTPSLTQTITQTSTQTNTPSFTDSPTPGASPTLTWTNSPVTTETSTPTITFTVTQTNTLVNTNTPTPEAYAYIEPVIAVSGDATLLSYRIGSQGLGDISELRIKIPAGVNVQSPQSSISGAFTAIIGSEIRVYYSPGWNAFSNPNFDVITFSAVSNTGVKVFESYLNGLPSALPGAPAGYSQSVDFLAPTFTNTPTITGTSTPTSTITPYFSPTLTISPTFSSTQTNTPSSTDTPDWTHTNTPTITLTHTGTPPTLTMTSTVTQTLTVTSTYTITLTVTNTVSPTITFTSTESITPTITITNTITIRGIDVYSTDTSLGTVSAGMANIPVMNINLINIGGHDELIYGVTVTAKDDLDNQVSGAIIIGNLYIVDQAGNTISQRAFPVGADVYMPFVWPLSMPLQSVYSLGVYCDIKDVNVNQKFKFSIENTSHVDTVVSVSADPPQFFPIQSGVTEIKRRVQSLQISGYDLMPPSVSTGQEEVYTYVAVIENTGTSDYSSSLVTGLTITVKDELSADLDPSRAISSIFIKDAMNTYFSSVITSGPGKIYCDLSQPITVTAGEQQSVYIIVDISGNTFNRASGFKVQIENNTSLAAADYFYPAQVTFAAKAGFSFPFESSVTLIQNRAVELELSSSDTMPSNVSTDQQGVNAMNVILRNTGNTLTASAMSTRMYFYIEDNMGNPVAPGNVINGISVTNENGSIIYGETTSFVGSKIAVNLTTPVIISGAAPVTLSVKVDIASAYNATPFRVVMKSQDDIYAVDSNVFVQTDVTGVFPAQSGIANINEAVTTIDLNGFASLVPGSVQKGQRYVPVMTFDINNGLGVLSANAELTSVTISVKDGVGSDIAADTVFENIYITDGSGNTLGTASVGVSNKIDFILNSAYLIPPGTVHSVTIYADILPGATASGFIASIDNSGDIFIQDSNSLEQATKVFAPAAPWETNPSTVAIAPSTDLYVWHDGSLAPLQVGLGQPDVKFMSLSLFNPAFAGSSDISVDGVTITAIDTLGNTMSISSLFDVLAVKNLSGSTVYGSQNVSLTASETAYVPFSLPIYVGAGNTRTVYVEADMSSSSVFTGFKLRLAGSADINSNNVPSGSITVTQSNGDFFPMDSGQSAVSSMAYNIAVGHENMMPISVEDGGTSINALKLTFSNINSVPVSVTSVAVSFKNTNGVLINASDVITNIYCYDSSMTLINALTATAQSAQSILLPSFILNPGDSSELIFSVDIKPGISGSFYIELVNPYDVLTDPAASVVPASGDYFGNLKSSVPSIQPKDLELSFHGFPNPFNPSREVFTIEYYLANTSEVTINIFTIYGRIVKNVVQSELRPSGLNFEDIWDGKNNSEFEVKSGVYLLVLEIKDSATGERMKKIRKVVVFR